MIPTLFGVTLVVFFIINLAPGGPVEKKIQELRFGGMGARMCILVGALHLSWGLRDPLAATPVILDFDPAGLVYIQQIGPCGAGGAAGAIYQFLGIREASSFPDAVKAEVTEEGDERHWMHENNDIVDGLAKSGAEGDRVTTA